MSSEGYKFKADFNEMSLMCSANGRTDTTRKIELFSTTKYLKSKRNVLTGVYTILGDFGDK